jgi:hypothetical protein
LLKMSVLSNRSAIPAGGSPGGPAPHRSSMWGASPHSRWTRERSAPWLDVRRLAQGQILNAPQHCWPYFRVSLIMPRRTRALLRAAAPLAHARGHGQTPGGGAVAAGPWLPPRERWARRCRSCRFGKEREVESQSTPGFFQPHTAHLHRSGYQRAPAGRGPLPAAQHRASRTTELAQ